eukprot:359869-Chlamydomonas_euryale.AAC.9
MPEVHPNIRHARLTRGGCLCPGRLDAHGACTRRRSADRTLGDWPRIDLRMDGWWPIRREAGGVDIRRAPIPQM